MDALPPASTSAAPTRADRRALWAVVALAAATALRLWLAYLPHWRQLWTDLIHDRTLHLDFGLSGASDLVHLRWIELARDVNAYRTWPPLHDGVMVGLTMLLSGMNPKAAVIPDLLCFVGTAVMAFVLVRALIDEGTPGAVVAATLVLVSPAMRAFATDVMIESAGACFTLVALHAAVLAARDDSPRAWTHLARALLALFLIKYNYWLLVMVSLAPLLIRAWPVRSPRFRALLWWHIVPSAVWLAIPGKFGRFVWYLSPGSNGGEFPTTNRLAGFSYYGAALVQDYHVGLVSALCVATLAVVAVLAWTSGRLRAGAGLLLLFLLVSTLATVPHPNRKSRFLHASIPAVWVLAGVGASTLLQRHRRAGLAACGLFVALHAPGLLAAPHAPEGGLVLDRPSALTITDAYLPALASAKRPAVLSNMPMMFLARWTYMDRYPGRDKPTVIIRNYDAALSSEANAAVFTEWIEAGASDVLVFVHVPPTSPWFQRVPGTDGLVALRALVEQQRAMRLQARWTIPESGGTEVSVWVR